MSKIRVGGTQFDIAWENPLENFRRVESLARQAVKDGVRILALPEMFATGFSMDSQRVSLHAADTRAFLADLAQELGVWILGGYAEPASDENSRPTNACSLMDPSGKQLLHYQKIHPFSLAGEQQHFQGGQTLPSAGVEGLRVTALICYDLRFPEPFRAAAAHTDLFIVIANWPDPRIQAWTTLLTARAIENQAYVLGVNRIGTVDGLPHSGCSALVDPMGRILDTQAGRAAIIQGVVDGAEVAKVRDRFSFLADRRPEVYRRLNRAPEDIPGSSNP